MRLIECRHAVDIENLLTNIFRFYLAIVKTEKPQAPSLELRFLRVVIGYVTGLSGKRGVTWLTRFYCGDR